MDRLIEDTADRLFSDHVDKSTLDAAEAGQFPEDLWGQICTAGLNEVGSADSGTTLADLFGLLKVAGRHALPLPLGETLIAQRLLPGAAFTTVAIDGVAAWGRRAERVVLLNRGDSAVTCSDAFDVAPRSNLAGEARDRVEVASSEPLEAAGVDGQVLYAWLALSRVALTAGALSRILDLAIGYATEREQFGRAISKFQAIQHNLAVLAGEVAAAERASDAAIEAVDTDDAIFAIAAAKSRVGEAAGVAAEIAHQVHGAMGFTHEHVLHHYTRRVWAWRDEFGRETEWQTRLGRHIAGLGADAAWPFIADRR